MDPGPTPRDVVFGLMRTGGASVAIKVSNGILAYVMLLVIARASSIEQYGIFAVAFSVAMSGSYISTLAQPWAVTLFWPQWMGQEKPLRARTALRLSFLVTGLGVLGAGVLLVMAGTLNLVAQMPWSFGVAAATALLTMVLACAEFSSAGLRAQGYVVLALAPRDIVWRFLICALFGGAALAGMSVDAEIIVLVVAGILGLVISPQLAMLWRSTEALTEQNLPKTDRTFLSRYSLVIWSTHTFKLIRDYAGVVIVSIYLGAEAAGAYFVADRTAFFLSFLLLAINLVSAPLISRYFHTGRKELVKLIVGLSGLVAGVTAFIGLMFFLFFGAEILSFFNAAYSGYLPILLILCFAQFIAAASGPVSALLTLSGHEMVDLALAVAFGTIGVGLQLLAGLYWGPVGVAVAAGAATILVHVIAVGFAWRILRIDTTGISLAVQFLRKLTGSVLSNWSASR